MNADLRRWGMIAAVALLSVCTGRAAEVKLKNGTVLQGEVREANGSLEVTTPHGKVVVPVAQVVRPPAPPRELTYEEHIEAMKKEVAAPRAPRDTGWSPSNHPDRFDDKPVHKALLIGKAGERVVSLNLQIHNRDLDAYIDTDEYLGFENVQVTTRIDDAPATTLRWNVSSDRKAAFAPGKLDLIGKLADAETLAVKLTPAYENPIVVEFDVRGLREKAPRLIQAYVEAKRQKTAGEKKPLVPPVKRKN